MLSVDMPFQTLFRAEFKLASGALKTLKINKVCKIQQTENQVYKEFQI